MRSVSFRYGYNSGWVSDAYDCSAIGKVTSVKHTKKYLFQHETTILSMIQSRIKGGRVHCFCQCKSYLPRVSFLRHDLSWSHEFEICHHNVLNNGLFSCLPQQKHIPSSPRVSQAVVHNRTGAFTGSRTRRAQVTEVSSVKKWLHAMDFKLMIWSRPISRYYPHISGGRETSVTIAGASTQTEVPINANQKPCCCCCVIPTIMAPNTFLYVANSFNSSSRENVISTGVTKECASRVPSSGMWCRESW
jgi:hypothetical protein